MGGGGGGRGGGQMQSFKQIKQIVSFQPSFKQIGLISRISSPFNAALEGGRSRTLGRPVYTWGCKALCQERDENVRRVVTTPVTVTTQTLECKGPRFQIGCSSVLEWGEALWCGRTTRDHTKSIATPWQRDVPSHMWLRCTRAPASHATLHSSGVRAEAVP